MVGRFVDHVTVSAACSLVLGHVAALFFHIIFPYYLFLYQTRDPSGTGTRVKLAYQIYTVTGWAIEKLKWVGVG